jgi:photosystem II stability/assembly factor-like uncharacterized protein
MCSFISIVFVLTPGPALGDSWHAQSSGTTNILFSVDFTDYGNGMAVGQGNTILRTTNGGAAWTLQSSPGGTILYGVTMIDRNTAVAVGSGGAILRTTDGGGSWSPVASGVAVDLQSVAFSGATTGIVVGGSGIVLRTTDAGATWQPMNSGVTANLYGATFVSSTTGYVVGGNQSGIILKSTDAGATWHPQTSGMNSILFSVSGWGENVAIAAGMNDAILRTVDGGASWQSIPELYGTHYAAFCLDSLTAYVSTCGLIKTTDGGATWGDVPNTGGCVRSLCMIDSVTGVAVGDGGVILRTETGSSYGWMQQVSGTAATLRGVSFGTPTSGIAVGDSGIILKTTDQGITWAPQISGTLASLQIVSYVDSLFAVTVGDSGIILTTSDGGVTWIRQSSGTSTALLSLHMVTRAVGYVSGQTTGLKTTDGGAQWTSTGAPPSMYAVRFFDELQGVAMSRAPIGVIQVRWTTDGGQTWSVSALAGGTARPRCVAMPGPLLAVGAGSGIIRSTNAGQTWTNYAALSLFNGISFADSLVGTVVGTRIYRTTDGGVSWAQQFNIFSSEVFSVAQITRSVAVAVGRDGLIYRTTTGGVLSDVQRESSPIPVVFSLAQNYPNPFNPATTIRFTLGRPGYVRLRIYDVLGRLVDTLVSDDLVAGLHVVQWDASTRASGLYFCRLESGMQIETKKLLLLR